MYRYSRPRWAALTSARALVPRTWVRLVLAFAVALGALGAMRADGMRAESAPDTSAPLGTGCHCAMQAPSTALALRAGFGDDLRSSPLADPHAEPALATPRVDAVLSRLGARGVQTLHPAVAPLRGYDATAPPHRPLA